MLTALCCEHFPLPSTLQVKLDLSEGLQAQVNFSVGGRAYPKAAIPSARGVADVRHGIRSVTPHNS